MTSNNPDFKTITGIFETASKEKRDALHEHEVNELLTSLGGEIEGGIIKEYLPLETSGLGSELLIGIHNTREFGAIIAAGLGGADTELFADGFKKDQAVVLASTALNDGKTFLELFKGTIAYKKLAGLTRGDERFISDNTLLECFSAFIALANEFSAINDAATFVIEELEINPFVVRAEKLVALDGKCRFGTPGKVPAPRPIAKIGKLLHPESIGIIGVSGSKMNFGRIILKNIITSGYDTARITIIKPGDDETIDGVQCVPDLGSLDHKLDLFVVAVGADVVLGGLADEIIKTNAAESVMLIPGGLGETEASREPVNKMIEKIDAAHQQGDGGPIFLGGNCLGIVSHPGNYDTWFIPQERLPKPKKKEKRNTAFISQSGAFMITRMSKNPWLDPAYMAALGNQNDITHSDMINYFADNDEIDAIGIYIEGFKDLDGLAFAKAVRQATINGKLVIVYKAGLSPEGRNATMGHTASIAGNYDVCATVLEQAGAIITKEFSEFGELFYLAGTLGDKKIAGKGLGAVSGAGFETVGMADSIQTEGFSMEIANLEQATIEKLGEILKAKRLDALMEIRNPFDINPGADDEAHLLCVEAMAKDPNVDAIVVGLDPLSPMMRALEKSSRTGFDLSSEESIANTLPKLVDELDIPIIGIIEGGTLYDAFAERLMDRGVCIFRSCERSVQTLVKYVHGRLNAEALRAKNQ